MTSEVVQHAGEPETRTVVRIDDLAIDEESGEILDWPAGVVDKIAYLQEQQIAGAQLEKDGKAIKSLAGRALAREMDALGERKLRTEDGPTSTYVRGAERRRAKREKVDEAVAEELITEEYGELLILHSATELDPARLEEALEHLDHEHTRKLLRALLIETSVTAGYVTTKPAAVKPPRVTREEVPA